MAKKIHNQYNNSPPYVTVKMAVTDIVLHGIQKEKKRPASPFNILGANRIFCLSYMHLAHTHNSAIMLTLINNQNKLLYVAG